MSRNEEKCCRTEPILHQHCKHHKYPLDYPTLCFFRASSQKMRLLLCCSCFIRHFHSNGAGGASQSHAADAKNTSLMNFSLYSPGCRFPLFKWLLSLISFSPLTLLTPRCLSHLWLVFLAELPFSLFNHTLTPFLFLPSCLTWPLWPFLTLWHPPLNLK